jgi:putative SOS response-associated peptidase YedK
MCGRFGVEQEYIQLALRYQATIDAIDPGPRHNVAPGQPVTVVGARQGWIRESQYPASRAAQAQ